MRKFLLLTVALVALAGAAHAADLSPRFKAPADNEFMNWSSSGYFWGLGAYGGVAQSNVNGNGTLLLPSLLSSNLTADGGGVEGVFGYIHGNTSKLGIGNWYMLEMKGAYQNISGGVTVPGGSAGIASHWSATFDGCVGADVLTAITAVVGNLGVNWPTWSPSLPANVQVGIPKQCLGPELRVFGESGQFGGMNGAAIGVAPGAETQFIYPTLGTDGKPNGGAIKAWGSVDWNRRGPTFSNLLAKGGGPVSISGSTAMATSYFAGIDILFAVK